MVGRIGHIQDEEDGHGGVSDEPESDEWELNCCTDVFGAVCPEAVGREVADYMDIEDGQTGNPA